MTTMRIVSLAQPAVVDLLRGQGSAQAVSSSSKNDMFSSPSSIVSVQHVGLSRIHMQASNDAVPLRPMFSSATLRSSVDSSIDTLRVSSRSGSISKRGHRVEHCLCVRALSKEATEEAHVPHEKARKSLEVSYFTETGPLSVPLLPRNRADDISLHNPLLRLERMGCGWLGLVLEWEGVIVEDDADIERKAWTALAEEEGRKPPPTFLLKRAEGMKNEQAISEVLCWSRDHRQMKRLAMRKEKLYDEMQGGTYRLRPGSREFIETMKKYNIPIAIASTRPRKYLERAMEAVGMEGFFNVVLASEDVYRGKPDPEMFLYAAERLNFIPNRCIVFGNSNSAVEAAHDACMKCVAVAGKHPIFELGAADLVVRRLDNLSMVDLKNLADLESEFQPPEPQPEMEVEEERPRTWVATRD